MRHGSGTGADGRSLELTTLSQLASVCNIIGGVPPPIQQKQSEFLPLGIKTGIAFTSFHSVRFCYKDSAHMHTPGPRTIQLVQKDDIFASLSRLIEASSAATHRPASPRRHGMDLEKKLG